MVEELIKGWTGHREIDNLPIVACVRTGTKYSPEYVFRLFAMVSRYTTIPFEFVCLTDRPQDIAGLNYVDVSPLGLDKWWGKMALFVTGWRNNRRVIYFDLDTVIINSIDPLLDLRVAFGICANFTRAAGNRNWPCRYGSCVMVLGPKLNSKVWETFYNSRNAFVKENEVFGDQRVIEQLLPEAILLQERLPVNFFIGYRNLTAVRPYGSSVVVFAGSHKPDNSPYLWVKEAWT